MQAKPQPHPQFIACLAAIGAAKLVARLPGVGRAEARAVMAHVADELCKRFAGRRIYVAAGHAQRRAERDATIFQAFTKPGSGGIAAKSAARVAQLAKQYGLTERHVRSILAAGRLVDQAGDSKPQPGRSERSTAPMPQP